jgi:hypothetical protein
MTSSGSWNPLRHPRRLGFTIFNLVVAVLVIVWLTTEAAPDEAGLMGLANVTLVTVGMVFLIIAWVVAWIAWAVLVLRRYLKRKRLEMQAAP